MTPTRWRYVPALDGVRALAVAAVVLFHWWPDTFGGGFIGVDVFFALSGYLITGMLLVEVGSTGGVDLRSFWMRRARRLLPAVWLLVAVTSLVVVIDRSATARWAVEAVGALTWTSNWLGLIFDDAPWWRFDDRGALDHLWSLAIEEQFYLIWPLVMLALQRWLPGRRRQLAVIGIGIAASAVAMASADQVTAYFATHTRAFGLLAGAALAVSGVAVPRRWASSTGAVSVVALAVFVAVGGPQEAWMYPWGFLGVAAVATLLTASLIGAPEAGGGRTSWLEWPPLRYVGRVSYGVYLWHVPIAVFVTEDRLGVGPVLLAALRFVALVVAVEVSFRCIEQPVRTRRIVLTSPRVALLGALIVVLAVPIGRAAAGQIADPYVLDEAAPSPAAGVRRTLVVGDLAAAAVDADLELLVGGTEDGDVAWWGVGEVGCVLSDVDAAVSGDDRQFGREDYCVHWPERWTDAAERYDPDAALVVAGYLDTLELLVDGGVVTDDRLGALYTETVEEIVAAVPLDVAEIVIVTLDPISPLAGDEREDAARDRAAAAWSAAAMTVADRDDRVTVCPAPSVDTWPEVAAAVRPLLGDPSRCPR